MAGWTTIRYLHAQGKSVKAIAAELGVARNTVRLAVRRDGPPVYARLARPNPQLAPFAEEIERMVVVERFIGSRVVRELKARGYTGGETAVYAFLRQRKAARPDPRLTMRFETASLIARTSSRPAPSHSASVEHSTNGGARSTD